MNRNYTIAPVKIADPAQSARILDIREHSRITPKGKNYAIGPSKDYIEHSAKGSEWEKHKYVKVEDGKYYYPDSYEGGRHLPKDRRQLQQEAIKETEQMLNVYADFHEKDLAIPVIKGVKTPSDKFAGAEDTYCIEALMHDGKALQAATSHYFGDGFARAFDITFTSKDNKLEYPHQTSWGCTTRMIGGIIMTHGDDNGLVLPPAVAPIQVVIIPVAFHKEGVLEKARELKDRLAKIGVRVKLDDSDQSPGWKYSEYEMKGVPLRVEIGPRDIEGGQFVVVTRHNREKTFAAIDQLEEVITAKLTEVRDGMYEKALANREKRTYACTTIDDIAPALTAGDGFVKAMWCGDEECEDKVKELTGVGSRCIPFDQENISDKCVCCGRQAKKLVYWGKAY